MLTHALFSLNIYLSYIFLKHYYTHNSSIMFKIETFTLLIRVQMAEVSLLFVPWIDFFIKYIASGSFTKGHHPILKQLLTATKIGTHMCWACKNLASCLFNKVPWHESLLLASSRRIKVLPYRSEFLKIKPFHVSYKLIT